LRAREDLGTNDDTLRFGGFAILKEEKGGKKQVDLANDLALVALKKEARNKYIWLWRWKAQAKWKVKNESESVRNL